jgi:ubiquinol-cytochrome c reductase subunit 8
LPGTVKQRGIVYYGLSANQQRPLAGTLHAAFFNVWRRFSAQALYVIPPFVVAYMALDWAIERYAPLPKTTVLKRHGMLIIRRNEYLNSKAGRAEFGDQE